MDGHGMRGPLSGPPPARRNDWQTLRTLLPMHEIVETKAAVPYLPLLHVPYYRFVGREHSAWPAQRGP